MRALYLDKAPRFQADYPTPARPDPSSDEALIRVRQAGICNTDLELVRGYAGFRGVLGHEFVGIVDTCPAAPDWVGRRVVGEINVACGACPTCRRGQPTHCPSRTALGIRGRDGAFADYLLLPVQNLHAVPDNVRDDQAVFVEPLAAALSITNLVHIQPTARVLLLGSGKLGQLIAQVIALTGCDLTVVGRHPAKLEFLSSRGIDISLTQDSALAPDLTGDIVIDATGTPAGWEAARRMVRPGGKLVLKSTYQGLKSVDLSAIVVDELQLVGSRCGPFEPALRLLAQGLVEVEPLIEARFRLEEGEQALQRAGQGESLKVLIHVSASGPVKDPSPAPAR
jgi:threonine dehydrogenase-like Zn-dependent dehydrogenase